MNRMVAAGSVLVLCIFGPGPRAQQPAPAAPPAGTTDVIAGRLTNVLSNQPVRKAQVALSAADYNLQIDGSRDVAGVALKFSSRRSEVTGVLTNPAGQVVSDHTVMLFPSDRRLWLPQSRRIQSSQPGPDGRYTFRDLPPGEYYVAALLDPEPGRHFDADYLGQLMPVSISLKLGDGEKRTQDIKIR